MAERTINYYLPAVGNIVVPLHRESALLLGETERTEELDRLRNTPQLGLVSAAHGGARHTRWDYVLLTWRITHALAQLPELRLKSSEVKLHNGLRISSGAELINSWALILQTGHLFWSFSSERALIESLSDGQRREVIRRTRLADDDEWAEKVLVESREYQYNQLIAAIRLPKVFKTPDTSALSRAVLHSYVEPRDDESRALRRTREIFRRVRRLAFLTLDTEYTHAGVEVPIAKILNDPDALTRFALQGSSLRREDELDSLEAFLSRDVYLGKSTLLTEASFDQALRARIASCLDEGLNSAIGALTAHEIHSGIRAREDLAVVFRAEMRTILPWRADRRRLEPKRIRSVAARFLALCGADGRLAAQRDAAGRTLVLQAHAPLDNLRSAATCLAFAMQFPRERTSDASQDSGAFVSSVVALAGYPMDVVVSALRLFFESDVRWRFDEDPLGGAVLTTRAHVRGDVEFALDPTAQRSASRRAELNASLALATRQPTRHMAFATASLIAVSREDNRDVAEFDGVFTWLDQRRGELVLTLVEAKAGHGRSSARAESDLRRKLTSLSVRRGASRSVYRTRNDNGVARSWVHLRIPYR